MAPGASPQCGCLDCRTPHRKARVGYVTAILGLYLFGSLTSLSQQPASYLFWCWRRPWVTSTVTSDEQTLAGPNLSLFFLWRKLRVHLGVVCRGNRSNETPRTWHLGQLKEHTGFLISRSLTLPSVPPWAEGVISWFSLYPKINLGLVWSPFGPVRHEGFST